MPVEFWREVVDRVGAERPDTLLLAEAFWLMEGYFVRTLGMHRVYNSAFMNMLRDEDNANYRSVIKNTLEFDPEILKRYVNFMNNPDERTAVDQFGKGDKYFGVCTLMVTLPGLPMFGHGQIEGFTERYGMEFKRASWDETPDRWLIERHEREIFPLLHRRRVFAEANEFLLYDFFTTDGHVNEDVFAYSNRAGGERALVLFHNRYASTAGWIRVSAAVAVKQGNGEEKTLRRRTLGEGLGLDAGAGRCCVFREHLSGLEFVRPTSELHERGLYAQLDAYRCHVFLDFREVRDSVEQPWAALAAELSGRGVPSAEEALAEIRLRPIMEPFRALANAGLMRALLALRAAQGATRIAEPATGAVRPAFPARDGVGRAPTAPPAPTAGEARALLDDVEGRLERLLLAVRERAGGTGDPKAIAREVRARLAAALEIEDAMPSEKDTLAWGTLFGWIFLHALGRVRPEADSAALAREWLRTWRWDRVLAECFRDLGVESGEAARGVAMIEALLAHSRSFRAAALERGTISQALEAWLADDRVQHFLRLNLHEGTWWFHKESWSALLAGFVAVAAIDGASDPTLTRELRARRIRTCRDVAQRFEQAAADACYRLDRLVSLVTN
jgi:hypothetical protein